MRQGDTKITLVSPRADVAGVLLERLAALGYSAEWRHPDADNGGDIEFLILDQITAAPREATWPAPNLRIAANTLDPIDPASAPDLIGVLSSPRELRLAIEGGRPKAEARARGDGARAAARIKLDAFLSDISRRLFAASEDSLDAVIQEALASLGTLGGADRAYVFRYFAHTERLCNTHEWCATGIAPQIQNLQEVHTADLPGWMSCMHGDDVILIEDVASLDDDWRGERALLLAQSVRSLVVTPLTGHAGLVGFVGLDAVRTRCHWSPETIRALRLVGDLIVLALTNRETVRELRASESRWKFALEGSRQGVWDWDLRTGSVLLSAQLKRMLGLAEEEAGSTLDEWSGRLHPEDLSRATGAIQSYLAGHSDLYESEHRLRGQDGGYRWILDRGLVVARDDDGRPLRMIGTHTDTTEPRLARQRLIDSEAQLEAILDNSQVGIMLLTGYRVLARCNQRLADILGYESPREMVGISMRQLHLDEERFKDFGHRYYENLRTRRMLHIEYQLRHRTGRAVWCMLSGKALDSDSPPDLGQGVIWVVDDITQIKDNERALREQTELFSGGPTMVFRWLPAAGWPIAFCSPNVEHILGYRIEELLAASARFADLVHPDDLERVGGEVSRHMSAGVEAFEQEYRIRHADGTYRTFYDYTRIVRGEDGGIASLLGYLLEVTRQRQAEEERLRLERELQQTRKLQALGQLTGGVAHEFNNMLAIILGQNELLRQRLRPDQDPRLCDYTTNIQIAGDRAKDLIQRMLTFGRPHERNPEPLVLASAVNQAISLSRASLPSSLHIHYQPRDGLPEVLLDRGEIQQVLMNLLVNARDAMAGKGSIEVTLERFVEADRECLHCHGLIEGEWVELSVADSGGGIPEADLARIFDPFFSTKPVGKGTGLGLSVVQQIIQHSGGHILVDSPAGQGARFRLLFPPLPQRLAVARPSEDPSPGHAMPSLKGSVLVVDDEPILTMILEEFLTERGLEVRASNDSREALEWLRAAAPPFDILITDQTMPELLGTELAMAAKAMHPDLRVVMCTGHSDQVNASNAETFGIDAFMTKPAPVDQVLQVVGQLLANRGAPQDEPPRPSAS